MQDKERTGRGNHPSMRGKAQPPLKRGEDHGGAKLNEGAIRKIRKRLDAGGTYRGLAREFGVDRTTIKAIGKRRSWRHVV